LSYRKIKVDLTRFFIITILIIVPTTTVFAKSDTKYLNHLVAKANQLELAKQRYWNLLLHYQFSSNGLKSTVDDTSFFLSKNGQSSPKAELEATLTEFFSETVEDNKHMRCRFVARYAWLKESLQIDESRLPKVTCSDFDRMITGINPKSVALIFPSAYLNSPPSMFGHTFLRIGGDRKSTLLSTAINYTAITSERMGVSYAFKGLSGGLHGYYYSIPYYEKIREYTAIESRDIWEYNLNLTEKETKRIVLHVWEMKNIYSEYFFLDENCSFGVLYLLEIARLSLRLLEQIKPFWITPISTVKAVVNSGIVKQSIYRPSLVTSIRAISNNLPPHSRDQAYRIAKGTTKPSTINKTTVLENVWPQTLDLASKYLQYMATRRMINSVDYTTRLQLVMKERAKLKWSHNPKSEDTPTSPDKWHSPGRIGIGVGCRTESCFYEINLRPVYHDRIDSHDTSFNDAHINLMYVSLRYNPKDHNLDLYSLRILDIMSIPPRDMFIKPLAWKMNIGIDQKIVSSDKERLVAFFSGGIGSSISIGKVISYTLAEIELNLSEYLPHGATLGVGASAGFLTSITDWWNIQGRFKALASPIGDNYSIVKGEVSQTFTISNMHSLSVVASIEKSNVGEISEAKILLNTYF